MSESQLDPAKTNSIYVTAGRIIKPYTNHRGERAVRRLITERLYFGTSPWHPEPQWLLDAWDCEKQANRTFALNDFLEPEGEKPSAEV